MQAQTCSACKALSMQLLCTLAACTVAADVKAQQLQQLAHRCPAAARLLRQLDGISMHLEGLEEELGRSSDGLPVAAVHKHAHGH